MSSEAGLVVEEGVENEDVVDTGVLDTISQQYESLDYDTNYNSVLLDEIRIRGYKFISKTCSHLSFPGYPEMVDNVMCGCPHGPGGLLHRHFNRDAGQGQVRLVEGVD